MDESISFFFCQFKGILAGLIIYVSVQDDFSAVSFCTVDLDERCGSRHNDDSLHSICLSGISHALSMIPCGCCYQPALALLTSKRAYFVVSASQLVCAGPLHILRFEIYLISGLLA